MTVLALLTRPRANLVRQRLVRDRIVVPKDGRLHLVRVTRVPVPFITPQQPQLPPVAQDVIKRERRRGRA